MESPSSEFTDAVYLVRGFEEALCNIPREKAAQVVDARLDEDAVLIGGCWDGRIARGKQDVKAVYRLWSQAFPERHMRIHAAFGAPYGHGVKANNWGYNVCVRWTFSGVNDGPINGMRPTNKKVTIQGVSIYKVRALDGMILESMRAWDTAAFLAQLGMPAEMPGPSALDAVANTIDDTTAAVRGGVKVAATKAGLRQPSEPVDMAAVQAAEAAAADERTSRVPNHVAAVEDPTALVTRRRHDIMRKLRQKRTQREPPGSAASSTAPSTEERRGMWSTIRAHFLPQKRTKAALAQSQRNATGAPAPGERSGAPRQRTPREAPQAAGTGIIASPGNGGNAHANEAGRITQTDGSASGPATGPATAAPSVSPNAVERPEGDQGERKAASGNAGRGTEDGNNDLAGESGVEPSVHEQQPIREYDEAQAKSLRPQTADNADGTGKRAAPQDEKNTRAVAHERAAPSDTPDKDSQRGTAVDTKQVGSQLPEMQPSTGIEEPYSPL